jgi:threonine/homoserine/homoserine lactone efflux protein
MGLLMINLLIAGILLGIYSGLSPGPMLFLVVSQTIKHDFKEGLKVAFTPLISDIPIIIISLTIITFLEGYKNILGIIFIFGGLYLLYLGYESFKIKPLNVDVELDKPKSLRKGVTLNLLNPSPYIFWITIGSPIIIPAYILNPIDSLQFIISFYVFLVSSKICIAYITGKSREFIKGKTYIHIMYILGIFISIFAIIYLYHGFQFII